MRFSATSDPREFWKHVSPQGCWEWDGARDKDGYGQTRIGMRRVKAHRKAWEIVHGPIPDGMSVLHTCDNPPCCRPDHLYLGTALENQRDKWARGRGVAILGSAQKHAKLTEDYVRAIRVRYATGTIRQKDLGAEYGVDQPTISSVVRRKTWKHIQ